MPRPHKPDPYNGFKSDDARRRALNVRAICFAVVGVAFALSHAFGSVKEMIVWLISWNLG
jgi:hypothetical protein